MNNTTVYLIRHGEVDNPSGLHYGRTQDVGLSQEGMVQLDRLGRWMEARDERPAGLYVSPLYRAQLSARCMFPDVSIITDDDLLETYSEGLEGRRIEETNIIQNSEVLPEGVFVEDPESMAERVIRVVTRARQEYSGHVVALVSHGDPITYALFRLLNEGMPFPKREALKQNGFVKKGTGRRMVVSNEGSILSHEFVSGEMPIIRREREFV